MNRFCETDYEIRTMSKENLVEIVLRVRSLVTEEHFEEVAQSGEAPGLEYPYVLGEIRGAVGWVG